MISRWEFIQSKIKSEVDFDRTLALWRFENRRIAFTNGCFDLLHPGHIEYLFKVAQECDILIVGLNTDASVKRLKGADRPITDEKSRAIVLAGLECVDAVVLFDQDTPLDLIRKIKPNLLAKGGDYEIEKIVGYQDVISNGGDVISIPLVEGFSTSSIIEKVGK